MILTTSQVIEIIKKIEEETSKEIISLDFNEGVSNIKFSSRTQKI